MYRCLRWRTTKTSRVRNRYTFGNWRALAGTGDVWRRSATHLIQTMQCALRKISLAYGPPAVALLGENVTPSLEGGGQQFESVSGLCKSASCRRLLVHLHHDRYRCDRQRLPQARPQQPRHEIDFAFGGILAVLIIAVWAFGTFVVKNGQGRRVRGCRGRVRCAPAETSGLLVISAAVASRQFSSWNMGMYEIPTIAPSGDCSLATV